jgi:hypothetical protein
MSKPMKPNT